MPYGLPKAVAWVIFEATPPRLEGPGMGGWETHSRTSLSPDDDHCGPKVIPRMDYRAVCEAPIVDDLVTHVLDAHVVPYKITSDLLCVTWNGSCDARSRHRCEAY